MIDLRYVKKLIDMMDGSTVDSIEIASDKGMKIRIAKTPTQRGGTVQVAAPMAMQAAIGAPAAAPAVAAAPVVEAPKASKLLDIKSPMVGTFYSRPEPTAAPYAAVGGRVNQGATVCIIEAMKIMNEIESEFSGVITEVLVSDSQPVEYGQVLFRIDPNG
jgi:acetyl-CoA carboxylase biotin carboxyl carrier protein